MRAIFLLAVLTLCMRPAQAQGSPKDIPAPVMCLTVHQELRNGWDFQKLYGYPPRPAHGVLAKLTWTYETYPKRHPVAYRRARLTRHAFNTWITPTLNVTSDILNCLGLHIINTGH